MGLLTKLGKTVIKAADKAKDINKQLSLDLPDVVEDTPIKMPTIIDDLKDEATGMLGNKEAIDNWKKENKVPKEESKRRKQRKFSEQAQDLQAGIMSGPEYRKYIRENQPATSFTPEDLKTMMPNFKQVVGALTKDKSDSGILGLNSSLEKGNVVSSRLDIPAYNEHDIWVTSIVDKEKGKLYGRTAVLKNVNFDMTNKGAKKLALDIATEAKKTKKVLDKETGERVPQEFTQTKTPFATMKGEWQDFSDKDAFALAEKYINDPEWIQVGFNPERHSFFYDKKTMMPVFNADAVVQIGALVLAKIPKLTTSALKAERINKLRKLRIDNMPEGAKPATFKEGGLVPMENQMNFALGGLKDEGGEIDEASGNRVPIGGTKEGVRDDIPANVSEGEFIFPADVVRYHGLDKMMALRQEAKMGLRKMESMGQMGNSEDATMPDDLPFEMADLIVVGGQGEPMEFANGGFVPQMQTLQTAPVPTMGGGTSTGTQTPIVYDDFMKTPVVTMQEYRNAAGESIIITSVNGKATTEIPSGYTLYVPPTNAAPTATQTAIQTANNYSYQTSGGGDEGPDTPRELQVDPDYASMDNDTYFSTMERQNSFGGKAGNAAAMGIALAMGPFGLLTMGMLQADKRRQLAAAEQRIAAETNPTKKKVYQATFAKMGGKTKEPEEENALVKFGKGFVTAVSGLFGLGNNDVEKVASVAGSAAADNTNAIPAVEQAPTSAVDAGRVPAFKRGAEAFAKGQPVTSEVVGAGPTALPMSTFADAPFGIKPDIRLAQLAGFAPASDRTRDILNRQLETGQLVERFMPPAPVTEAQRAIPTGRGINMTVEKPPTVPAAQIPYTTTPISVPSSTSDSVILEDTPTTGQAPSGYKDGVTTAKVQPSSSFDLNRALSTPFNIDDNIYSDYDQQKEQNIYYGPNKGFSPEQQKDIYFSAPMNRQSDRVSVLEGQGFNYPISTSASYFASPESSSRVFKEPSYTTGTQTDAAFGPQTDAGALDDMIAGAPVRTSAFTGEVGNQYAFDSSRANDAKLATEADDAGRFDQAAQTPAVTQIDQRDPYRDDVIIPQESKDYLDALNIDTSSPAKTKQMSDNYLRNRGDLVAPVYTGGGVERQDAANYLPAPVVTQQAPVVTQQPDPMNDPRQAFADDRVYSSPREEADKRGLSESELTLGRARNVATMPDPYVASLNSAFGRSSVEDQTKSIFDPTDPSAAGQEDYNKLALGQTTTTPTSTTVADEAALVAQENSRLNAKPYNKRTEALAAKSTSKGTSTRKAAPTGDDRLSQANFLERALGITPAPISARRGNDGVLYRTQADKREADNRQEQAKATQRGSDRYKARNEGYQGLKGDAAVEKFNKDNAADIGKRHGGDKEDGSDRVICTELYKQGKLDRELYRMDVVYTAKHLSPITVRGYHYWAVPMVVKMRSSTLLTNVFEYLTIARAKEIAHIVKPKEYKDRSVLGYLIKNIGEAICYSIGLFTDQKDWTVLYNKGAVK